MTPDTREKLMLIADDVDWIVSGEAGPAHDNALRLISKRLRELAAAPVATDGWQTFECRTPQSLDCALCGGHRDDHRCPITAGVIVDSALAPNWRPISTAPKHQEILTCRKGGLMSVAAYFPHGDAEWCATDGCHLLNVTHWQPLPAPPTDAPQEKV